MFSEEDIPCERVLTAYFNKIPRYTQFLCKDLVAFAANFV